MRNPQNCFPNSSRARRIIVSVKRFVTHRFRMDQIQEALNLLDTSGIETMKVIVEW